MATKPSKECETIVVDLSETTEHPKHNFRALIIVLVFIATLSISFLVNAILVFVQKPADGGVFKDPSKETILEPTLDGLEEDDEEKPEKIDFQPVVDAWVNSTSGDKSVVIYDLDLDEVVGSYNAEASFGTASLYKLFVVLEGYRRVERGDWKADATVSGTGHTILECLDFAIRESHSPCAEGLWEMIGHNTLDKIIADEFKITDSEISVLTSNANDITSIMKLFYKHPGVYSKDLLSNMWDSFLNQPTTTYNWRRGLPSGFSDAVKVYNKVGWDYDMDNKYWNLYHDTAIVEVPSLNRHFVVTVLTHRASFTDIRKLATKIEAAIEKSQLVSTEEL